MSSDGSLIRSAYSPGETLDAVIAWRREVRDYCIIHGRCGETTQIQDALRFTELKERATEQLDTQSFLNTHHAFHVVGRQLADEAERHGIDATALYSFLDSPDPDDGARRALLVADRLKARLVDRLQTHRAEYPAVVARLAVAAPAPALGDGPTDLGRAEPPVLSAAEIHILQSMAKSRSPQTQAQLADSTQLSRGTICKHLRGLRAGGLISRPKGERGGEAITDAGRKALGGHARPASPARIAH